MIFRDVFRVTASDYVFGAGVQKKSLTVATVLINSVEVLMRYLPGWDVGRWEALDQRREKDVPLNDGQQDEVMIEVHLPRLAKVIMLRYSSGLKTAVTRMSL